MLSPPPLQLQSLIDFVDQRQNLLVITGAGISAQSGIPTYRDDNGSWQHSQPIQHQDFIDKLAQRQRYWSRSAIGWPTISSARPNPAHHALVELERRGKIKLLVTQNVDRLHQYAGHQNVVDLHGRLDQAICLGCGSTESREQIQQRLLANNPFLSKLKAEIKPDGDAEVADTAIEKIQCPLCLHCNDTLMPDVIFFGGSVPKQRVEKILSALASADGVLIVGSSLMVRSSYRFCVTAAELNIPITAINKGKTRADDILSLKVEADCSETLQQLIS
ncbi:NAD-dependent protein deacetylase [Oceanicoccus sp. KOV_DT_Chl]|uniref:NAD-dependent protein deacetylase n=1 Tax=Oceanicoccus sp. KOV_DT_Chl TaxID=1904639 RepID=UPI000C7D41D2|nr:NAD-dependent protein deacetylase [Oceanicoccus sp. KOV_DT_Chl]